MKATGYAEPLTVRLFVKWEGPNGSNTLSTYRAVLRLAQPNTLGQNGYAHEHEIAYNLKNNTHIHLNKFLPYDVLLFKAVPDGWTNGNFGPDPNALAKCFEVSLSNTTTFDTSYVIGENSNAAMWKRHALDMNTLLSSGRRFIVVREKDCIICPTAPNISIITAQSNLVICNPNDLVTLRIDTTNLPNCINTIGEKGPFQWGKVGSNGQLQRLNANDLYRCHGQYGFNFFAQGAGTYWIRLGHEWWCWPNTETRFEVTVNCASIQTATDRQNRTER
ncbi:MAG: hypothetical protein MUE30_09305 [Spirosomaceae bacterium]|nr:hypothetical protein [Spirosomataceae bacterium]